MHSTKWASNFKLWYEKSNGGISSMLKCGHTDASVSSTVAESYPNLVHDKSAAWWTFSDKWDWETIIELAGPISNWFNKTFSRAETFEDPTLIDWICGLRVELVLFSMHHGAWRKRELELEPKVAGNCFVCSICWKRSAWEDG